MSKGIFQVTIMISSKHLGDYLLGLEEVPHEGPLDIRAIGVDKDIPKLRGPRPENRAPLKEVILEYMRGKPTCTRKELTSLAPSWGFKSVSGVSTFIAQSIKNKSIVDNNGDLSLKREV